MKQESKPGRGVKLMEENIAPEDEMDSMIKKLPQRIRACIRKANWISSYKQMLDKDPCCSYNWFFNYLCLTSVREGNLVLA